MRRFTLIATLLLFSVALSCFSCGNGAQKDFSRLSGTYENKRGDFVGTVDVKHKGDNKIGFDIVTGTASGCTGEKNGTAALKAGSTSIFVHDSSGPDGDCRLEFIFDDKGLKINETKCDFHGMRCSFDGDYKKVE